METTMVTVKATEPCSKAHREALQFCKQAYLFEEDILTGWLPELGNVKLRSKRKLRNDVLFEEHESFVVLEDR